MAPALALAGGGLLLEHVLKSVENKKLREQADQIFAHMKRTNEYVKNDPELAAEAFDTLRSFAPTLAAKPIIARTFIEQIIQGGMIPIDQAKQLAQTEKTILENGSMSGGFLEGLKQPMSMFNSSIATHDGILNKRRNSKS